jgi:alkanesulfonate monooxygenase SsuD/methylene tetrahydromethanopterin reductase-like flavin-dependent oxidoreductase (luciferase family)
MLGLAGRLADGWVSPLNIYLPPEQVPNAQALIDAAARSAERDPAEVRRIYNVVGAIGDDVLGHAGLHGSADVWARALGGWAPELGFDTFVFWPRTASPEQVRRFASEVAPRARDLVDRARQATAER